MHFTLDHPEIRNAIADLKQLVSGLSDRIDRVELFGSTLLIPVEQARDIDFFVAYRGVSFDDLRSTLLRHSIARHVVVEAHEASYANCPKWEARDPLTLHIVLYKDGLSAFSDKLLHTRKSAIDITQAVIQRRS